MKRFFLLIFSICSVAIYAQSLDQMKKYMKFAPSNLSVSDVKPSDIPSENAGKT